MNSRSWLAENKTRDRPLTFHWQASDAGWLTALDLPLLSNRRLLRAREAILLEALIAHHCGWPGVSYSRRREFYAGQRRYHGTDFTFRTVVRTVDELAELSLLVNEIAPANSLVGRQSVFKASSKLV